ncbi:MAG: class I SAM-dependent methyltransferase [Phenylobacterium sp.]|uniref:class I SAM-dependent methyltransferase n=1 Tax=Phenylobacterium sp. TaxID=1871053 RepID=UPI001A5A45F6|nr:methyltransferase [Phenylobacterium sp.]MBL8553659.1 class I SAM-dependent methyltransferase [Phenylobacterium sp.]
MTLIALFAAVASILTAPLLDAPGRTDDDRARDRGRKPAETLAFAEVKPGWKVAEYTPGGGYFTRLLSPAVGAKGRVYAYPPDEIVKLLPRHLADARANAAAAPLKNVTVLTGATAAFAAPEPLDLVFTAQNYHDLHTRYAQPGAAAAFNAAVFHALKPGGRYVIVDHRGPAAEGAPDRLHRIDPAEVRREVEAAGFRFDGESAALANPADPGTAQVFDPKVRGATDQFMLRFRKP